jgi:hypothetical protein
MSYCPILKVAREGRDQLLPGSSYRDPTILICPSFEIALISPSDAANQPAAFGGVMKIDTRRRQILALYLAALIAFAIIPLYAQNLGSQPALNRAVQGQTAAQPEGAFLNLVNWIGNVIAPVGAVLCVVMAVVSYTHGRGVARWAVAAAGLLMVSGLTRLIEFWIQQGQSGVQ